VEISSSVLEMFMSKPIPEWKDHIVDLNLPDYYITFSGLVINSFTLAFDDATVDALVPILMDAFGIPEDQKTFILEQYIPEVNHMSEIASFGKLGLYSIDNCFLFLLSVS
jgi:hypothetical protein